MERAIEIFYRGLITLGTYSQHIILLFLRLIWGWLLFGIGMAKLGNIQPVIEYFTQLGIPYPVFNAYLVGLLESVGGTCLLIGFASRLFALPLVILLFVAMATAHHDVLKMFFSDPLEIAKTDTFSFFSRSVAGFCLWSWGFLCGRLAQEPLRQA